MLIRFAVVFALAFAGILSSVPAKGGPLLDFCNSIPRDIKRRQCWPKPFVCPDREAVRAPFAVMVCNGWQRQNTLDDNYFEEGTGQLTKAGQLKVRWIVTEGPTEHREVYVHRAETAEETAARVNAVHQFAACFTPPEHAVPVLETDVTPRVWPPADHVDDVLRKFESSAPKPRLPSTSQGANSGAEAK